MANNRLHIKAFTLPELLVYMVVTGVVFMVIMEGFGLFSRYADRKVTNIVASSQVYEGYHRLAMMIHSADSVVMEFDELLQLFAEDKLIADIYVRDSLLTVRNDTLLTNICSAQLVKPNSQFAPDTIKIVLAIPDDEKLILDFPIYKPVGKVIVEQTREREINYRYESIDKQGA